MSTRAERVGRVGLSLGADAFPLPGREWVPLALAFAAIYVVWGSTYLAIAVAVETLPPLLMMSVRSMVAGAVLYLGARRFGAPAPTRSDWLAALRVGVLFFVVGHGLLSWSETRVPSGAAAVLIATEPLFIVLLGWLGGPLVGRPRGARPSGMVLSAVALGLAGVAVLTLPGMRGALDVRGALGLLVASFAWSVGTYHVPRGGAPFRAAGMQLFVGGLLLLAIAALLGELRGWHPGAVARESWLALAYLVTFGSVVAFGAYVWLLGRVSPARVSSHTYVNPLIAVALGAWLGGESVGARVLLAAGLVLTAVLLLVRRAAQRT